MGGSGGKGGDTARSIGYQWTPEGMETLFVRSKVLVDSRAAGVQFPVSGGWFDIRDLDGLRIYAHELKRLGYNGMSLIHPYHVPVVNEVFTPSAEEIAEWQGLVDAMERMRETGGAAVTYGGDMVDIAHEQTARAMLRMAGQLGGGVRGLSVGQFVSLSVGEGDFTMQICPIRERRLSGFLLSQE